MNTLPSEPSPSPGLKVHLYPDAKSYVEAVGVKYDAWTLNLALAPSIDAANVIERPGGDGDPRVRVGVWVGEELLLVLVKVGSFPCVLSSPIWTSSARPQSVVELQQQTIHALVDQISAVLSRSSISTVVGPSFLVDLFTAKWSSKHNLTVSPESLMTMRLTYMTQADLSRALDPAITKREVDQEFRSRKAEKGDSEEAIARLFVGFTEDGPYPTSLESAKGSVRKAIERSRLWISVSQTRDSSAPIVAGYLFTGRITPNTATFNHVFVDPKYRGKGIAESLVRSATAFYLGLDSSEKKRETALFVENSNPVAERVYGRSGFRIHHRKGMEGEGEDWVQFHEAKFEGIELGQWR